MRDNESAAVVSLGEQMKTAGVVPHGKGKRYSPTLRANVVEELRKPGANARRIAERFNVGESTVAAWRLQYIGRIQLRATTPAEKERATEPDTNKELPAAGVRDVASVFADSGAQPSDTITLTRQEARTLALVVRETVKRMSGADELTLGRLALLALKLVG